MSAYTEFTAHTPVDAIVEDTGTPGMAADMDFEMNSFKEPGTNSVSKRIELPSVEYLQTVLGRLGNVKVDANGERLTDDIWGCTIHDESAYLENAPLFSESKNTLQLLRESQRTLTLLLDSLSHTLTSLRRATKPAVLAQGIASLPDELLAHTFRLLVPSDTHSPNLSVLLRVSRRFRSITVSTPRLWSLVPSPRSDATGRWRIRRTLALSRNIGLHIELPLLITPDNKQNPDWEAELAILMAQKHRWRSLSIDFASVDEVQDEVGGRWVFSPLRFPPAVLDSVECICAGDLPQRYSWPSYGSDFDDASVEFYDSWTFPSCTSLISEMHIPPPGVLNALTDFSLDLSIHIPADDPDDEFQSLDALVEFLNSVPQLQRFKLTTGEYRYRPPAARAHLPALSFLRFENRYPHPEALRLMYSVAHAIVTPNLAEAEFFICVAREAELAGEGGSGSDHDPGDEGWAWLSEFFPAEHSYPKMRRLALDFRVSRGVTAGVGAIAARFPALEALELVQASAHSFSEDGARVYRAKAPGLKKMRFCDVHLGSKSAVREYTFGDPGEGEGLTVQSFYE